MLKLSAIFSVGHFALAYGLRFGFKRTAEVDPVLAGRLADVAEKIDFVLTQPGLFVAEKIGLADGSGGFWIVFVLNSILWGNILAFVVKRFFFEKRED